MYLGLLLLFCIKPVSLNYNVGLYLKPSEIPNHPSIVAGGCPEFIGSKQLASNIQLNQVLAKSDTVTSPPSRNHVACDVIGLAGCPTYCCLVVLSHYSGIKRTLHFHEKINLLLKYNTRMKFQLYGWKFHTSGWCCTKFKRKMYHLLIRCIVQHHPSLKNLLVSLFELLYVAITDGLSL